MKVAPHLGNARLFQQVRLWIYILMMIAGAVKIGSDRFDFFGPLFVLFALVLMLLETCPVCGKWSWKERAGAESVFWVIVPIRAWSIGPKCRADAEE